MKDIGKKTLPQPYWFSSLISLFVFPREVFGFSLSLFVNELFLFVCFVLLINTFYLFIIPMTTFHSLTIPRTLRRDWVLTLVRMVLLDKKSSSESLVSLLQSPFIGFLGLNE